MRQRRALLHRGFCSLNRCGSNLGIQDIGRSIQAELHLEVFLIVFLISDGYHIYQASSQYLNRLVIFWSPYFYLRGGKILLSMAAEEVKQVPATNPFVTASSSSEWYEHLKREGSCLRLLYLLAKKRELIHQLGPEGITVLHKGVEHGCVRLVKFILVDMFDDKGVCTCKLHGPDYSRLTRDQLLRKTNEYGSTAVNIAVVSGSPKMVLLLNWAIDKNRQELRKLRKKEVSQTGGDAQGNRRVRTKFTRRKECEVEGEDLQRLFEVYVNQESIPSTSTGPCLPDAAEEILESVSVTESNLAVPDVKDHTIDKIYKTDSEESINIPEVYNLVEEILFNEDWGNDQETVDLLIDRCQKHVSFEFVPVPHVFLHFLLCTYWQWNSQLREKIVKRIVVACKESDDDKGGRGSRVVALFNMLDPRGRTILHAALQPLHAALQLGWSVIDRIMDDTLPASRRRECWNARDGAGRTILHLACIYDISKYLIGRESAWEMLDMNVDKMFPLRPEELDALKIWCFPRYIGEFKTWWLQLERPMHLAVLFNSTNMLSKLLPFKTDFPYKELDRGWGPLQVAAFFGRIEFLEHFLKRQTQYNSISDEGLGKVLILYMRPAIHIAAQCGQVEAIRSILKYPIYDPMIQYKPYGTALHLLLQRKSFKKDLENFHMTALFHVLPNNYRYKRIESDFNKLQDDNKKVRPFSANEINCINLLLQGGIDIWTPNHWTAELPTPGRTANDEAQKWWYEKVIKEVVTLKTSISGAANATSVVAALVATASFIGPLQPPLGLSGDGGYVDTSRSSVQVYLVFNSLSFFFSIGSILMAVLPAIPMPKESLYDELLRSQRCLKGAALMLLVSIMCILVSFSSANMAVVSSRWRDKGLVVVCIVVGGSVCIVVLGIYIIRLLRMLFHKNVRFRRWFAKHMYF